MVNASAHKAAQAALYDAHLLDDLAAGAGIFGFAKPKLVRDLAFARHLRALGLERGEQVLDVGCNAGARLEQLRREFAIEGVGIDVSPASVAAGTKRFPKLALRVGDAEKLPFPDNSFDAVISFETFEHLPDPGRALAEMARVVRPGGRVLIYAISRRNALTWHWWLYYLSRGKYGAGALGDHTPDLLVPPEALAEWVKTTPLQVQGWEFFHSFFTIIYDEVVVHVMAHILEGLKRRPPVAVGSVRSRVVVPATGDAPIEPGLAFRWYRGVLVLLAGILFALDWPWRLARLSDGFFVWFTKPAGAREAS